MFEVCDCPTDSVTGVASRHEYQTLLAASAALIARLTDEYDDARAELLGIDEETGRPVVAWSPLDHEFSIALDAVVAAVGAAVCADVTYRGVRYWIEEHEAHEGGFRERD